jgi:hypothetical protein
MNRAMDTFEGQIPDHNYIISNSQTMIHDTQSLIWDQQKTLIMVYSTTQQPTQPPMIPTQKLYVGQRFVLLIGTEMLLLFIQTSSMTSPQEDLSNRLIEKTNHKRVSCPQLLTMARYFACFVVVVHSLSSVH